VAPAGCRESARTALEVIKSSKAGARVRWCFVQHSEVCFLLLLLARGCKHVQPYDQQTTTHSRLLPASLLHQLPNPRSSTLAAAVNRPVLPRARSLPALLLQIWSLPVGAPLSLNILQDVDL
jgi:hypothetical protein